MIARNKKIGPEYCTFQFHLPDEYMNTGGAYREDEEYLNKVAVRISKVKMLLLLLRLVVVTLVVLQCWWCCSAGATRCD